MEGWVRNGARVAMEWVDLLPWKKRTPRSRAPTALPTISPMWSMGVSSLSPSPFAFRPVKLMDWWVLRIASVAAPSAAFLWPLHVHRAQPRSVAPVTRTSSGASLRSVAAPPDRVAPAAPAVLSGSGGCSLRRR